MIMIRSRICRYNCGVELGQFDEKENKYREASTGMLHTRERCEAMKNTMRNNEKPDQAIDDLISRLGKIPLIDIMNKDPNLQWMSVLDCINFEHVAVTKEQVERFKLPSEIDEKTRQKLEGYWKPDGTWKKPDPNTARFIAKHGRLYSNELDSLPSRAPDEFKKMVIDSVDRYYDETIYQGLIDEYAAVYEETRESLREKVRLLDARLADEFEAEDD